MAEYDNVIIEILKRLRQIEKDVERFKSSIATKIGVGGGGGTLYIQDEGVDQGTAHTINVESDMASIAVDTGVATLTITQTDTYDPTLITLFHAGGNGITQYEVSSAGLDAALTAADTADDIVKLPACAISGNHTVPTGIRLSGSGRWQTTLTGKITAMPSSEIDNLSIVVTGNSNVTPVIAIEAHATMNTLSVYDCEISATNTGDPFLAYGYYATGGNAFFNRCTISRSYFDTNAEGEFHESYPGPIYCTYPNVKLYNCQTTREEDNEAVLYYFDASFDMREPWEHSSDIYDEVWMNHLPYPGTAGNIAQDNGTSWESVSLEDAGAYKVMVNTSDAIPDYLEEKLVEGQGISLTTLVNGGTGERTIEISQLSPDNEPMGFASTTNAEIALDADEFSIGNLLGTFVVYVKGKPYTKGQQVLPLADIEGLHYIYFQEDGLGDIELVESPDAPDFSETAIVAAVYWDGSHGLLSDERHGITMDWATHSYLHSTIGTRYKSGLAGSFTDTTFSIDEGYIFDEDLAHHITAQTTCRVLYRNGSTWNWTAAQTKYYHEVSNIIQYDNSGSLANVTDNRYVAYWIYATGDTTTPIISIMGQREDITIANARLNNTPETLSFGALPYAEMKLLYRVILRRSGTSETYQESTDYRSVTPAPTGTYVATDHGTLTGLTDADHPASAIYTDTTDFDGNLSALDDTVQKALDTIDDLVISGSSLTVEEVDGDPSEVTTLLKFPNGSLANTGVGEMTVSFAASLTLEEVDASPSVSGVSKIITPVGSLVDNGGGEVELRVLSNPMSAGYDLIRGSTGVGAGSPTRFAKGTSLQLLRMSSDALSFAWTTINMQAIFTASGTLSVGASTIILPNATGRTLVISKVYLIVGTAPTGAAILVDIHKNGTTIFTTQSNRPTIADGATSGNTTTIEVSSWDDGEYLTMEIDQVGSTVAGSDLTVAVVYS